MRKFWRAILCLLLTYGCAAADTRPNLILIIGDDLSAEDCSPYGNKGVQTPNLERLARGGMRFTRGFVTTSSCSPSRASLITGKYPHNTGAEQLHWPLPGHHTTFVQLLKQAGYYTAAAGKWHLGPEVKKHFDQVIEAGEAGFQLPVIGKRMIADDKSGCQQWVPTLHNRPKDKPFFLWLAALDPHRDYEEKIIPNPHRPNDVTVPPFLPDVTETRKDLAMYYDEIARLDRFVGDVLTELERQNQTSNTFILFIGDNGRPFPRCKTRLYDSGIHSPWIVRWPAKVKPGSVCERLVSTIDIAPTFIKLAGLGENRSFQGRDFSPLFENPQTPIRDYIYAEHHWHDFDACERAVRSENLKYIRNYFPDLAGTPPADAVRSPTFQTMRRLRDAGNLTAAQKNSFEKPRPAEELYDLNSDPQELNNLAADPGYSTTLAKFRKQVESWQKETHDSVPVARTPDEFDRETGEPLPDRKRPRSKK
ncbi:MAG TPA: sulfatase [Verrucomicrobiae bacterium]|nr:sulfatase [Verrucomicrobiae bacterium]